MSLFIEILTIRSAPLYSENQRIPIYIYSLEGTCLKNMEDWYPIFRRAFLISSNENYLKQEIKYLKNIFIRVNNYPKAVVENTFRSVKDKISNERDTVIQEIPENHDVSNDINTLVSHPYIVLPYLGFKGENVIRKFKNVLKKILPNDILPRFVYKGKKLGSFFRIKDKINDKHKSNLIYGYKIPCRQTDGYDYIGMSKVRHETRTYEHLNSDKNSAIFQHKEEHNISPSSDNFDILAQNYNNWLERRICESLYARDYQPVLNKQKNTHKLELFT